MEDWEREVIDEFKCRVLYQGAVFRDGAVRLEIAAANCGLLPSEFLRLYERFAGEPLEV